MLEAGSNALVELPASVGRLRKLKELIVYTNKLTSLPESIGELEALEVLQAPGNAGGASGEFQGCGSSRS